MSKAIVVPLNAAGYRLFIAVKFICNRQLLHQIISFRLDLSRAAACGCRLRGFSRLLAEYTFAERMRTGFVEVHFLDFEDVLRPEEGFGTAR